MKHALPWPVANYTPELLHSRLAPSLRPLLRTGMIYSVVITILSALTSGCAIPPHWGMNKAVQIRTADHTLSDPANPLAVRVEADKRLVRLTSVKGDFRLRILQRIICTAENSPRIKIYALAELAKASPATARALLQHRLYHMNHWRVLIFACRLAVSMHDAGAVDALFRSLKRPGRRYAIGDRPEASAIRDLTHQTLRAALWRRLAAPGNMPARVAALEVLDRIGSAEVVKKGILGIEKPDAFITALAWYIRQFDYLPRRGTEAAWVEELYGARKGPLIRKAMANVEGLLRDHLMSAGLAPRYLALAGQFGKQAQLLPMQPLYQQVAALLAEHRHIRRPAPYAGAPTDITPTLSANQSKLDYWDLLLAKVLLTALARGGFAKHVWQAGDASRQDRSSEEGGLIICRGKSLQLQLYDPAMRINNTIYVSSGRLLLDTPRGIAQFIFHFQHVHNARYTGPAEGDLRYVRHTGCSVVIFTSIGRGKFDTVLDTPSGAVLDLGVTALH